MCDSSELDGVDERSEPRDGGDNGVTRRTLLRSSMLTAAGVAGASVIDTSSMAVARPAKRRVAKGVEVVLLGSSGGPPPQPGRAGIASALSVHGATYVIDCGRSAVTQYMNSGLAFSDLRSIFLTHLHADHVADYYNFFLLAGWGRNNAGDGITSPVSVYGPGPAGALPATSKPTPVINPSNPTPGTAELTASCLDAYAYSDNVFMRDSGMPDPHTLFGVHEIAIPNVGASPLGNTAPSMAPFPIMEDDRVRVSAVLVPHGPVFPAFAFRFDTDEVSVVFSGDTAQTPNIPTIAADADLLVHEAIQLDWYRSNGASQVLLDHLQQSHTATDVVGRVASEARVGTLALSHLGPGDRYVLPDGAWLKAAHKHFHGPVVVGNDLVRVPVRTRHRQRPH